MGRRRKPAAEQRELTVTEILASVSVVKTKGPAQRSGERAKRRRRDPATMEMTARVVQQETINAHAAAVRASTDPDELKAVAAAIWIRDVARDAAEELTTDPDVHPDLIAKAKHILEVDAYAKEQGMPASAEELHRMLDNIGYNPLR